MQYKMVFDAGSRALKCAIADESNKIIGIERIIPKVNVTEDGFGRSYNVPTFWDELISLTKRMFLLPEPFIPITESRAISSAFP